MKFKNQKGLAPVILVLLIAIASSTILIVKNTAFIESSLLPIRDQNLFSNPISKATPTPTSTITPAPTPSPSPTPTPAPTPTPTFTATPTPKASAAPTPIPAPVVTNNTPPGAGYSRQNVSVEGKSFLVSIIAADLGSTRVIVDTASDSDCSNDCPVLSLADYVSRNGAYAGVNGSYFCPATYPSCAGKTNSYDTLLMNKNKKYFNTDNNVYSTVPAVIFGSSWIRFVSRSLEWGRDTGIDGVIANYPLLVLGGQVVYGGDSDPKHQSKGNRSFVGAKGNTVYIGVVYSSTLSESAKVLQALGMQDALNLDDGGSTALWSGGYKVGPGRNLPNAVLFVRK